MINDEYIINTFYKNDKIIPKYLTKSFLDKNYFIKEYLLNRYPDFRSFKETIYRIKFNINEIPLCTCGKKLEFIGGKDNFYRKYCSYNCMNKNKNKIQKGLNTIYKKFGKNNYNNREKYKETCLKKYGENHPWKNKEIFNKCIETCEKKYNIKYYFNKKDIKEYAIKKSHSLEANNKRDKTNLLKFGNKIPSKSLIIRKKLSDKLLSNEIKEKKYLTYKKNNSFHTSKPETECYNLLKEKYKDIEREYRSNLYPFNCDFYIPNLDLYIEYNGSWTHGNHPFNSNSEEDINKLKLWESKNTQYYNNAINTWTIRDIKKREIAKKNNLNYIEFWNLEEVKNWLKIN